jgi:hypothetical protein
MDKIGMDRIQWIRDLVKAEEQMEENGVVDLSVGIDSERVLLQETLGFLLKMKNQFIETSVAFNELKISALGRLKIYGIAKTPADFMLFRNGFKMIFSVKAPGAISIRFNFISPNQYIPSQIPTMKASTSTSLMEEHEIVAKVGAFGDLTWTFQGLEAKLENIVKYHMSLFIKESAK